nr:acetate--CoA ligase [Haloarchaeobius salinus]
MVSEQRPVCDLWNPADCTGTVDCPPRCPRFLDDAGRPHTVYSLGDCPTATAERARGLFDCLADDADALVALDGETPVGAAALEDGSRRVELGDDAAPSVGTELVRQLVAHERTAGASLAGADYPQDPDTTLDVSAPGVVVDRLVDAGLATNGVETGDDTVTVDLGGDAASRTTRPPVSRADYPVGDDFSALFEPDRVAVVGATDREGAIGRVVVENLRTSFEGSVVPVTSRADSVLGLHAVDDVADADADLVVVVLPADAAVDAVRRAGEAGVGTVAVLSAGFGESDDAGRRRERQLASVVDEHDLTLVGPNALGVCSTRRRMNASFAPTLPDAGGVSVLSHSGALVTATLDWADATGVGVRDVVSVGNGAGLDVPALLRYWGSDPETDVVLMYLEDLPSGRRFVEAARAVSRTTPIVVLKSGRTGHGAAAAASHTGALVGDDAGFQAAFDAAGVVRADSQQAAYDLVRSFATQPLPRGDAVAVVTNAGGPGVLATDAVDEAGLSLADLSDETRERLDAVLPDAASAANPVDVLGDATVDRFVDALDIVLADRAVDAAVVASTPHPLVDQAALVRAVGDAGRRYGTPVVTSLSGGPRPDGVTESLAAAGVPNFPDADRAARALASLTDYASRHRARRASPDPTARGSGESADAAVSFDDDLLGVEAMDVLREYGVRTPDGELARTPAEAATAVAELTGPFVLKVVSPDLAHKTEVGGVEVGVAADAVEGATADLLARVSEHAPDATLRGVLVQELVEEGVECLVGVTRHERFGPVVTFGLGGILVEHLDDVAHGLAPLSPADAERLLRRIDGASVLDGARGQESVDRDALVDALVGVSRLAADHPSLSELEVNPLMATPTGATAVDFQATADRDG